MSSIRSSLSHVVRPITSKTRLLSGSRRSSRRPASLDLQGLREARLRPNSDGFDSWDTSAVDPENRQTVLESSSPPPSRFLETIPASPKSSRSPSPATPSDVLEPPRTRRRSRSYSPVSTRTIQAQRAAFTQQASHSEAHIHPLFRSDSPVPPPSATPGTVVVAAPNAGKVISDKQSIQSIRSMRRLRSESLPPVPSPLSRPASCDSFHRRAENSSPEIREEDEAANHEAGIAERKMTPPIPDWILSAGPRSSLTLYNNRKVQTPGSGGEERSVAEQQA
ncbi:9a63c425-dfb9-43d5-8228-43f086b04c91 [Thermothielavioides terrestris]|nr:9a63c425-dfb9-43d5-8228-43f086b04c91 [Thermothielavioides terrestris]